MVALSVSDHTDSAAFLAFDMEVDKLTNIQASEAVQIVGSGVDAKVDTDLPQSLADIVGNTYTFQLKEGATVLELEAALSEVDVPDQMPKLITRSMLQLSHLLQMIHQLDVQLRPKNNLLWMRMSQIKHIHTLSINMRLRQTDIEFVEWILGVGNRTAAIVETEGRSQEDGEQILVADKFMLPMSDQPHQTISDAAYPNFVNNYLNRITAAEKEYLSSDSVAFGSTPEDDWTNNYTQEYLNSLEFAGLPNHKLSLKVGAPVMTLRNLNR
ncbi:hypothetical protein YC2023_088936 [Brassica napus]